MCAFLTGGTTPNSLRQLRSSFVFLFSFVGLSFQCLLLFALWILDFGLMVLSPSRLIAEKGTAGQVKAGNGE